MNRPSKPSFRALIKGLSDAAPVVVGKLDYTGEYLATMVAINPNLPDEESAQSTQLISEVGRLTAMAYADKQRAEVRYRIWRDSIVFRMTNSVEEAKAAGFKCAQGGEKTTGRGNDKVTVPVSGKTPSVAEVERYLRTLPEYAAHYEKQIVTEEAWATLHTTLEAAKQRVWAIRGFERSGGPAPTERKQAEDTLYPRDEPPAKAATLPAKAATPPIQHDKTDTPPPVPIHQDGRPPAPPARPGPPPPPPMPQRKG